MGNNTEIKNKKGAIIKPFVMPPRASSIEEAIDNLAEFYKELGWDFEKDILETERIYISKENYMKIHDMYFMIPGITVTEFNATVLAYLPNMKDNMPKDIVIIEEGAFKAFKERGL